MIPSYELRDLLSRLQSEPARVTFLERRMADTIKQILAARYANGEKPVSCKEPVIFRDPDTGKARVVNGPWCTRVYKPAHKIGQAWFCPECKRRYIALGDSRSPRLPGHVWEYDIDQHREIAREEANQGNQAKEETPAVDPPEEA
jgi:hypothetical protein